MPFDLFDYEPVEDRIRAFWLDHPTGRIETELITYAEENYIVKALIWRRFWDSDAPRGAPDATGYAQERQGSSLVNKTSALENCETSAIGRALANLGYAARGKRPSREEMRKSKNVSAPSGRASSPSQGEEPKAGGTGRPGADTPSDGGDGTEYPSTARDPASPSPSSTKSHAEKWNPTACQHQLVPGRAGWLKCTKCGLVKKEAEWA